jgi:hypothetical protein
MRLRIARQHARRGSCASRESAALAELEAAFGGVPGYRGTLRNWRLREGSGLAACRAMHASRDSAALHSSCTDGARIGAAASQTPVVSANSVRTLSHCARRECTEVSLGSPQSRS